jgi:Fe-S-cluster-containing hydrogenase component 2/CRP-like cAMP-binding protein
MDKKRKLVLNPPADLEPRAGDVSLPLDRFLGISLFARLKKKPNVERFPGTLVLRRYRRGEVICRQGEAGWTAFYALTGDDLMALRQGQLATAPKPEQPALRAEVARLEEATARAKASGTPRPVATVYLVLGRGPESAERGLLSRLRRRLLHAPGRANEPAGRWLPWIPISNLRDVSPEARQATLYEGDLFGEMSCMYGAPRSATIVAADDCYALEMLRNILDEIQADEAYRAQMDTLYRERVLQIHLERLPIFRDLTEDQLARLRDGVELVRFKAGQVIFDEHDRSDSMFIVRSGLVKAVANLSLLLSPDDVVDWPALCRLLPQGRQEPGHLAAVWQALPGLVQETLLAAPDPSRWPEETRAEVVLGLNKVIKNPPVPDPKGPQGFRQLPADPALGAHVRGLPADPRQWPDLDRRLYGRLLLEAVLPGTFRPRRGGPESVLSYLSAGDSIGDIGLMIGQPRKATCLAYAHPEPGNNKPVPTARWRKDEALVELVRIPERLFHELVAGSVRVRARVEETVTRRKQRTNELAQAPAWEDRRGPHLSRRFEELGLIQGQRLMLIDLERCTRCDECVRACVDTHEDGRNRLILDGPRFGKYLVPTTCRSCLDPVCLIGCPVGSIHRGDNREIVIEDWCIGCGLCATNCPYGAIQMNDIGLIPEGAHGWRYYPAAALAGLRWTGPKYGDRHWLLGQAPFRYDPDLRAALGGIPRAHPAGAADPALCFRYEVRLPAEGAHSGGEFRLQVTSTDGALAVWVNGQEVTTSEKPRSGKREYRIAKEAGLLRAGRNVVAVRVTPTPRELEVLLDLRLDDVRPPVVPAGMIGDISEKLVTERAVVCDLCSSQFGQRPACVSACPHDAALRVDARSAFPGA